MHNKACLNKGLFCISRDLACLAIAGIKIMYLWDSSGGKDLDTNMFHGERRAASSSNRTGVLQRLQAPRPGKGRAGAMTPVLHMRTGLGFDTIAKHSLFSSNR